jgi:hypothetical protein
MIAMNYLLLWVSLVGVLEASFLTRLANRIRGPRLIKVRAPVDSSNPSPEVTNKEFRKTQSLPGDPSDEAEKIEKEIYIAQLLSKVW